MIKLKMINVDQQHHYIIGKVVLLYMVGAKPLSFELSWVVFANPWGTTKHSLPSCMILDDYGFVYTMLCSTAKF
jgi:hypothetical protein